jgi:hypothetical protein
MGKMTLRYRWMGWSLALLLCGAAPVFADDAGGLALEQAARAQSGADAGAPPAFEISVDPVERAHFTVDIFRATCYDDFFDQQKIRDWAGGVLTPMSGTAKQVALDVIHADTGDVWSAKVPGDAHYNAGKPSGGEIALVLEPSGRCHILSFGTDAKAIHQAMTDLSENLSKTMPDHKVDYKYAKSDTAHPFDESMIGVITPLNNPAARDPTMVILGDTAPGGMDDITAAISIYANFDPNAGSGAVASAAPSGVSSAGVDKPVPAAVSQASVDDKPFFQTVPLKVSSYTSPAIPLNVPAVSPPSKAAAPKMAVAAVVPPAPISATRSVAAKSAQAHPVPVVAPAKPVLAVAASAPMAVVPAPKGFSAMALNAVKAPPVIGHASLASSSSSSSNSTLAPGIPQPFSWGHTASVAVPKQAKPVKTASTAKSPAFFSYKDPPSIAPAAGPAVARAPVAPVEREAAPPL